METNKPKVCRTFYDLKNSAKDNKRYSLHQGGARAGKTYSILQYLILLCYKGVLKGAIISIVRKTAPALRGSVMRDFIEILQNEGIYSEKDHNKTNKEYTLNTNLFEFISTDDAQKIRGRKRDIAFCNEANELNYEDFVQLDIRTTFKFIIDYNPSITDDHWIVKQLKESPKRKERCEFFKTTYLDNPFIPQDTIDSIEALRDTDEALWKIFGLGEQAQVKGLIYKWYEINNYESIQADHVVNGMDFGFTNDPSTLVEVKIIGNNAYASERLYKRGMLTNEIAQEMTQQSIPDHREIIADSAAPDKIEEIHRYGFNIKPCIKFPGSKKEGIDAVKRYNLYIDCNSLNLLKEIKHYKWKEDKNGNSLNEPIAYNDHLMDALAYALHYVQRENVRPTDIIGSKTIKSHDKRRVF